MSCGGNMMRSPIQPLAWLVDAAAEKYLAADELPASQRNPLQAEIARSFSIGDKPELTFHGHKYILTVSRDLASGLQTIDIHTIALNS